jgi:hypothetical protein
MKQKPAVLVVETPDEDPYVVVQGEVAVVQVSRYALSKYCSEAELADIDDDYYQGMADEFEQGSDPWFHLMGLQKELNERKGLKRELVLETP